MLQKLNEISNKNRMLHQCLASFGVLLLLILIDSMVAWSSPYIAVLTSSNSPFPVTLEEASWVISLINPGKFLGAVGSSVCLNYFGSKTANLINCVPMAFYWLFTVLADNVKWLYAARFVGGFSFGATICCCPQYVAEITDSSNRGTLYALSMLGLPIGDILMSTMGAYLDMQTSAAVNLFLCVVTIAIFIWLPESPHHLVKKKLYEKAKSSIEWYHTNCDAETEIMKLQKFVEDHSVASLSDTLKKLKSAVFYKSIFLIAILNLYSQLNGQHTILSCMESVLITAQANVIAPAEIVIIIMLFGVFGCIAMMLMLDSCGRKTCLYLSFAGVAVAYIFITMEFQLLSFGYDPQKVQSLLIVGLILLIIMTNLGSITVPFLLIGELFPPDLKSFAACFIVFVIGIFSFIVSSTYIPLINLMTQRYVYLFYGIIITTTIPFIIFYIPETKGLSLQEIQSKLMNKPQCTDVEENSRK